MAAWRAGSAGRAEGAVSWAKQMAWVVLLGLESLERVLLYTYEAKEAEEKAMLSWHLLEQRVGT